MLNSRITVHDAQSTAMWRFHDSALERAALIYTFARSTTEDIPAGALIYSRQLVMLIDLVHEFCFNARRAIERAEKYLPGTIEYAQALKVHNARKEIVLSKYEHPDRLPLTEQSLWWVLGRIIHSKDTQVIYRTVDVVVTNSRTGQRFSVMQPAAFAFASDRDDPKVDHYVDIELLATVYIGGIAPRIEQAINNRNYPRSADAKLVDM
jgi:hypothetical protein